MTNEQYEVSVLSVCIDFKSPYAFVAHELIWQLEVRSGFLVNWLRLTLNIGSFLGRAEKRDDGGLVGARLPRHMHGAVDESSTA